MQGRGRAEGSNIRVFSLIPRKTPSLGGENFSKGCWITQYCGFVLTPQGYDQCVVVGGIERIMRFGYGLKTFREGAFPEMLSNYCRFCGHFLNYNYRTCEEIREADVGGFPPTWKKAY